MYAVMWRSYTHHIGHHNVQGWVLAVYILTCVGYMGRHRDIDAHCFYNSPTDFQALVTLLQTRGFNLYSGIKSIFGTLVWTQQQQSDYQAAGPNGDFYGFCSARNGVHFAAVFSFHFILKV